MAKDTEVRIVGGVPTSVTTADNLEGWTNESGAVAVNDAIYLSGASAVAKASATDGTQPCVGLVFEVTDATHCKIITHGLIENFSTGMTAGTRYYLSAAAAGALVTTPPSSTGNSVQYVGYATSGTDLLVEPDATPWVKVASSSNNALYWDPTNKRVELAPGGSGGGVPTSRTISTTAPLTGGGDLTADRTFAVSAATTDAAGVVELATSAEETAGLAVQASDSRLALAKGPRRVALTRDQLATYSAPSLSVGQIQLDASLWHSTATIKLRTTGLVGGITGGLSLGVSLYNLTDGEAVTGASATVTATTWTAYASSTLTVGSSAGNLKNSAKLYEVRLVLSNGANVADFGTVGTVDLEVA